MRPDAIVAFMRPNRNAVLVGYLSAQVHLESSHQLRRHTSSSTVTGKPERWWEFHEAEEGRGRGASTLILTML